MQNDFCQGYNFDICFLSILLPPEDKNFVKNSKFPRSQNITAIQLSIIDGLTCANTESPYLINTPLIPLFPRGYKYPIVRSSAITGKYRGVNHSIKNVPFLYSSSLFSGAKKHLKKWASSMSEKPKIAIAYSLTHYTLKAMEYIKKINPSVKTAIIVPDLPQYTYASTKNVIRRFKNKLSISRVTKDIDNLARYVDLWILFSKKMKECLPPLKNDMLFEGVATDCFENIQKDETDSDTKTILYAGGLNENYGVRLLLDAFEHLEGKEWKLLIAGKGPMADEITRRAGDDPRIKYLGEVPRERLLELEKNATALVNPRVNSGIFTRYSFPSKNMEYLSSETPMIGFKLDGIPDEYDDYINYFSEETPMSLASVINDVCCTNSEKAIEKARLAKDYVLTSKNKYFWGQKILQKLTEE